MEIRKMDLVERIAESNQITKTAAKEMIDVVSEAVKKEIAAGNSVILPRFVGFYVKETDEREGRNPLTGETMTVKANRKVIAKISSNVKKSVKI
jgi:DNA-binding protein HU-beta